MGAASLTRSTVGGLSWLSLASGAQMAAHILLLAFFARTLSKEAFGHAAMASVVTGLAQVLVLGGIAQSVVQWKEHHPRGVRTLFTVSVCAGAAFFGLAWATAAAIANAVGMPDVAPLIKIASAMFLFQGVSQVAEALLSRQMSFRLLAAIDIASYVAAYVAVAVPLAWAGAGAVALVVGAASHQAIRSMLCIIMMPHPKALCLSREFIRRIGIHGSGISMATIANYAAVNGDNIIVGKVLGADALGLYSRAYQLMSVPATLFGRVAARVAFPAFARAAIEPARLRRAHGNAVELTALVALPMSLGFCFTAPEITEVLLGPGWDEVVPMLQVMAIAAYFRAGYKVSDVVIRATGRTYLYALAHIAYAVLVLGSAYIGAMFGVASVAVAVTVGIVAAYLIFVAIAAAASSISAATLLKRYRPGVIQSVVVSLTLAIILQPIRDATDHAPWLVLAGACVAVVLVALPLTAIAPRVMLGDTLINMRQASRK